MQSRNKYCIQQFRQSGRILCVIWGKIPTNIVQIFNGHRLTNFQTPPTTRSSSSNIIIMGHISRKEVWELERGRERGCPSRFYTQVTFQTQEGVSADIDFTHSLNLRLLISILHSFQICTSSNIFQNQRLESVALHPLPSCRFDADPVFYIQRPGR